MIIILIPQNLLSQEEDEEDRLAVVSKYTGKVNVRHNLMVKPVTSIGNRIRNSSVYKRDTVITKPASTASLVFNDNTSIEISEESNISIDTKTVTDRDRAERKFTKKAEIAQQDIVRNINVKVGKLLANITPSKSVLTEFETPTGVATVRGTKLNIGYVSGITSISLFEGLLGFTSAGNEVGFDITPGTSLDIAAPEAGTVTAKEGELRIDTGIGKAIVEKDEKVSVAVDTAKAETLISSESGSVALVTNVGTVSIDKGEAMGVNVDPVTGDMTVADIEGDVVITTDDGVTTSVEPGKDLGTAKDDNEEEDNEAKSHLLFIFDSSKSMNDLIDDKETKLEAAKKALSDFVAILPADLSVGLEVYGHRETEECEDIEIVVPVGKLDVAEMQKEINSLQAFGATPVAAALEKGAAAMTSLKGKKTIVLISDGVDTCNGDPVSAAKHIREEMGIDVIVQVAGLGVDESAKEQLKETASAGGGNYYAADNAQQLEISLKDIEAGKPASMVSAEDLEGPNLLLKEHGGQILMAPKDEWKQTIDGVEEKALVPLYSSAVYGFKYEQLATFDTFVLYIPGEDDTNLKEFELLVSDRSWSGPFRSIGVFQAQNGGSAGTPYQPFTFPEVTTRYLKVQLESNHGDGRLTGLYEFQLLGELKAREE
ncbi:MAG: VWA domain-containing protein [Candidatus Scalindua sp.]|nr:VWA domain-containing protein [Candidatus Scalindua sp.]